ncbi:MAG TPA: hypothetical protein ENH00_02735 [Actinobacteria bacterium]|nr:hypothetical protein [Actinomycetota bacterium]
MVGFELNGAAVEVRDDHPHLLAAVREELGVTSPKDGCAPSGQCGACTVLVDGKARVSCQLQLEKVAGRSVTTLEGLDPDERTRYADAFAAYGATQCGFCTPGIIMRSKALIDKKGSALSRDDLRRHLGANLCRCTGYIKIFDAIEAVARGEEPGVAAPEGLGSSGIKYEARELALGERGYVDDMRVPGLLHGALRLVDHARADVLRIDTSAAESLDGVAAVYTGSDVPGELRVGLIHKDWPVFIPEGGRTSYLGDVLAIVVAETRDIAERAAGLVDAEYHVLTPITDPKKVLSSSENAVWGLDGSVLSVSA